MPWPPAHVLFSCCMHTLFFCALVRLQCFRFQCEMAQNAFSAMHLCLEVKLTIKIPLHARPIVTWLFHIVCCTVKPTHKRNYSERSRRRPPTKLKHDDRPDSEHCEAEAIRSRKVVAQLLCAIKHVQAGAWHKSLWLVKLKVVRPFPLSGMHIIQGRN